MIIVWTKFDNDVGAAPSPRIRQEPEPVAHATPFVARAPLLRGPPGTGAAVGVAWMERSLRSAIQVPPGRNNDQGRNTVATV